MLDHGPAAESSVQELLVAGDSAGGNLALAVAMWARFFSQRTYPCFYPKIDRAHD
ncbi:MAG: alpha/beta hydrolase [Gammaproteobacteria bacterium]|nr:alpha/beta hydrolase [Gammaproteobacteria bacterium]